VSLVEVASLLVLAENAEVVAEACGGAEGVLMVRAADPAIAVEGVLVAGAGLLIVAEPRRAAARLCADPMVEGWSVPNTRCLWARVSW
jgi:hypothetical protein